MNKEQIEQIEQMSIGDAEKIERDELCKGCGLWPCYSEPPECFRYEEEA